MAENEAQNEAPEAPVKKKRKKKIRHGVLPGFFGVLPGIWWLITMVIGFVPLSDRVGLDPFQMAELKMACKWG